MEVSGLSGPDENTNPKPEQSNLDKEDKQLAHDIIDALPLDKRLRTIGKIGFDAGFNKGKRDKSLKESLDRLSNTDSKDVQGIGATQMEILNHYYSMGMDQSKNSFKFASAAALAGLAFFIVLIAYSVLKPQQNVINIASLGTVLSGFITGISFYTYNKSTSQLSSFHDKLFMTQRYLLANSMCEEINGGCKDETRSAIIKKLADVDLDLDHSKHSSNNKEPRDANAE